MKNETAHFIAQLASFKTLKDGGYRLTLDFGRDSLASIQKLIKWTSLGEMNFAVVLVPYRDASDNKIETEEI